MQRRTPQQQPARDRIAQQQQMAGAGEFQAGTRQARDVGIPQQMGEARPHTGRATDEHGGRHLRAVATGQPSRRGEH